MGEWGFTDKSQPQLVRVGLCGPTRSGKTTMAASFPRPAFIFPTNENSVVTLGAYGSFPFKEVSSMTEMNQTLDELLSWMRAGTLGQFCSTLVFDSLSHFSEIVELELTRGGKEIDWDAYNLIFKRIREVAWQLPVHVVVTMLDRVKTDKKKNVIGHGPRLYGQAGELLLSSCEIVAYCEQLQQQVPEGVRINSAPPQWFAHVQQAGAFCAGTRIPGMPNKIYPNFNFAEHIAPYLQGAAVEAAQ